MIAMRAPSRASNHHRTLFIQSKPQRSWSIFRAGPLSATANTVSSPSAVDPSDRGYYFDWSAIRTLRRIEGLRSVCGDDFPGIKIILDLMTQLERLQSEVRSTRESTKGAQKGKVH